MGVREVLAAAATAGLWGWGAAPASAQPAHCLQALVPLAADGVPQSAAFAPAACPAGDVAAAFRHDGVLRATRLARAVAAGEIVSTYPEFGLAMVLPGDVLRLVVVAGAARVERRVVALQPARPGQRLFVRGGDGAILSVRYEAVSP